MTALNVFADNFYKIGKKVEDSAEENVLENFVSWLKGLEDALEGVESSVITAKDLFANAKTINLEEAKTREIFAKLLKEFNLTSESLGDLADNIRKNNHVDILEKLSPKFIMRLNSCIDELEDLAENVEIALNCADELKELESLANKYSEVATR